MLSRFSVRVEVRDEETRGLLRCGLLEAKGKGRGLTEDFLFYACGPEGESQRRNSGVGDTERR